MRIVNKRLDILDSHFDPNYESPRDRNEEKPIEFKRYEGVEVVELPEPSKEQMENNNLYECINIRRSWRRFTDELMTLEELSMLLYLSVGVRVYVPGKRLFKQVPSGGSTHSIELILLVDKVEGLQSGIWAYDSPNHALILLEAIDNMAEKLDEIDASKYPFVKDAAVNLCLVTTPERALYKYDERDAQKLILLDAGHIGQAIYLAVESLGLGTCAVGNYNQVALDKLLHLEEDSRQIVYLFSVGRRDS